MPTTVRIENQSLAVDVSSLGAEMQALTSKDGRSWLWNGDATFWGGRSPVLFPIVGKAPGDKLGIDGQDYPMGQHGFARRNEFALESSTATACRHELVASEATRAIYPFDFRLVLEHSLDGNRLTVAAEVTNKDNRGLPFGIGFHPAFVWPLPGARRQSAHGDARQWRRAAAGAVGRRIDQDRATCPRHSAPDGWSCSRTCSTMTP